MGDTKQERALRQERVARTALARFGELADLIEQVVDDVFMRRVPCEPAAGADQMVLGFVTKQREHLRSMRSLIAEGQHRDAFLIGRTMLEGLGRLLWAFERVPERTDLWLYFGVVLDWRQILKNEASGIIVDPAEKEGLRTYLDQHGSNYYRPNVRKAVEVAERDGTTVEVTDDPWRNVWTDTTVEDMFAEVKLSPLYKGMYRESSEWVHWGPRSILRAQEPAEWGIRGFTEERWRDAVRGFAIGCYALLECSKVMDRHFTLGRTKELNGLKQMMETIMAGGLDDHG